MNIMLVSLYILPGNRFSDKSGLFKNKLLKPESKLKICSVKIIPAIKKTRKARIFPAVISRLLADEVSKRNKEIPDNKKQSAVLNLKLKIPGKPLLNPEESETHPIRTHTAKAIMRTLQILDIFLVIMVSFI